MHEQIEVRITLAQASTCLASSNTLSIGAVNHPDFLRRAATADQATASPAVVPISHAKLLGATSNHALADLVRGPHILATLHKKQVIARAKAKCPCLVYWKAVRVQLKRVGTFEFPELEVTVRNYELEGNVGTAARRRVGFKSPSVSDW